MSFVVNELVLGSGTVSQPLAYISGSKGIEDGNGSFSTSRTSTATVQDFEGLIRTCKVGETRYYLGRRVENLAIASSIASGASMTLTLTAGDYNFVMNAGSGTATFSGTGGATGTLSANASSRTSVVKTITAGTLIITASVATLTQIQITDVSGQANQNPEDYVDYNTVYNAGVTGVRYFETYNGNTVASNIVTEAMGALLPTKPTILIEPVATNVALQSGNISSSSWLKGSIGVSVPTVVANSATGITGKLTASKISYPSISVSNNYALVYQQLIGRTLSIYLKGVVGGEQIYIMQTPNGSTHTRQLCTLTTTWQKFVLINTISQLTYWQIGIDLRDSSQSGKPAQSIYVDGVQVVTTGVVSSYIPTTTTAVSRAVDNYILTYVNNLLLNKGLILLRFNESTFASAILAKFVSLTGGSNLLYKDISDNNLRSNDGTTVNSLAVTFSTSSDCIFALAWSSQLGQFMIAASIDGGATWTNSVAAFDGSFTAGSAIELFNAIEVQVYLKAFKTYSSLPGNMTATYNWIVAKAAGETIG